MIAALLAAAPVAAEGPLAPAGKWRVDYGELACTASRAFGEGKSKVELLIERIPFGSGTSIYIVVDAKMAPGPVAGDVSLAGEPGEAVVSDGAVLRNLGNGRRAVRLYLPAGYVKTLARAAVLRARGGGLHIPALQIDGTAAVAGALASCERTFAKDLGIDPAATARIVMPASPIDSADVFQSEDYPYEAIRREMEGDTYILWRVDTQGKAQDCRLLKSSGHEMLDRKSCEVVMARGRFVPAHDAAGVAIDGYLSRAVRWRMPRS